MTQDDTQYAHHTSEETQFVNAVFDNGYIEDIDGDGDSGTLEEVNSRLPEKYTLPEDQENNYHCSL